MRGPFDAVLAFGNALAHLAPAELASMRAVCRPGGLVLASVRDYAPLVAARPRVMSPQAAAPAPASPPRAGSSPPRAATPSRSRRGA